MDRALLTLNVLYKNALNKYREKTALRFAGQSVTYGELHQAANRVAHALIHRGVTPNTKVALLMSNCLEYVMSDIGIIMAGATKVPLNDMLGEKEIEYILRDSGAEVVLVGPRFIPLIEKLQVHLPRLHTIVAITPHEWCPNGFVSWEEFQAGEPCNEVEVKVDPEDMAMIVYTGGTTGVPKGVLHNQENLVINLYSHVIELEWQSNEKLLLMSPLPHSAGVVLLAGLLKGAEHWIEAKFDPQLVLDRISKEKITFTFMVPTMIYRVMDQIGSQTYDLRSLRTILYGAAPITTERLKQGLEIFGSVFTQFYGQTEAPNFITRLRKEDHSIDPLYAKRLQSCGQPVMMCQVKMVDDRGKEVPRGQVGEIMVRTPYNMIGYHQQPDKTNETLKAGWLVTGDIGMMDEDGYVYLLDRKKDMVISGGMNVYTTEVENVLQKHPGIRQASVIGVPHSDWGEAVVAFIVPRSDAEVTIESILETCNRELSQYKRPKEIIFVESLPLTPYGKIDKKLLRKPYWENSERQIN